MKKSAISGMDNLPDEILAEILYRLRIKPLFRCRCVSKQWNSVISDPKFSHNYRQSSSSSQSHLSAFLYPHVHDDFASDFMDLIDSDSTIHHTDDDTPPSLYPALYRPGRVYRIEASSDGLLLGCYNFSLTRFGMWHEIFVFNPLTNQSINLTPLLLSDYRWACGLTTHPNQDCVTYKVVFIQVLRAGGGVDSVNATIDVFSSDTGGWIRKERISCPSPMVMNLCVRPRLFSYKGILHFFNWNARTIVTYDPYDNPDRFGSIQLPIRSGKGVNLIRLDLEDELEFGEIEDCGDSGWRRLCVWRLADHDKREWCLETRCPISPLWSEELFCNCRLLVATDPRNAELFYKLSIHEGTVMVHDLASAEKVYVDPFVVRENWGYDFVMRVPRMVLPIELNPWASPSYREAAACNSSSNIEGFRRIIIPAWFPSYSKYF